MSCRSHKLDLPSDLDGVMWATYKERADGRLRAALSPVGVQVRDRMVELGLRRGGGGPATAAPSPAAPVLSLDEETALLQQELDTLTTSAEAQGWTVKTHSASAYRVVAPDGRRYSLSLGDPRQTRRELRDYAQELNEYGLRLNRTLITPVGEVPAAPPKRATERRSPPSRKGPAGPRGRRA